MPHALGQLNPHAASREARALKLEKAGTSKWKPTAISKLKIKSSLTDHLLYMSPCSPLFVPGGCVRPAAVGNHVTDTTPLIQLPGHVLTHSFHLTVLTTSHFYKVTKF